MSRDPLALHFVRALLWGVFAFWCLVAYMLLIAVWAST